MRRQQPVANPAGVILHTVLIPPILQVLIVLIHTAVMTIQLLASNMEGHGTALIANIVHQVLTAQPVQLLTAVRIIQPLALKPEGHGTALIARCPIQPVAPLTVARATIRPRPVLKPEEHGTGALARCRIQAVQAALPRIPPQSFGYSVKLLITSSKNLGA